MSKKDVWVIVGGAEFFLSFEHPATVNRHGCKQPIAGGRDPAFDGHAGVGWKRWLLTTRVCVYAKHRTIESPGSGTEDLVATELPWLRNVEDGDSQRCRSRIDGPESVLRGHLGL